MLQGLKENYFIRTVLFKLLNGFEVNRCIKGTNDRLYFNAGTNFNFFFSRVIEIEKHAGNNLAKILKGDFHIFDIGAHIGYYTVILSRLLRKGKLIAFEPNSDSLKYLKKNVEENLLTNVTVVEKGLSSRTGEYKFYKDISTGRSSSLESSAWHPNAARIKEVIINTTTLDEAAKQYGNPDFIKCDVEGHEFEVLTGANEVLKSKPILFVEVAKQNRIKVLSILKEYGYAIYDGEKEMSNQSESLEEINCQNILCI